MKTIHKHVEVNPTNLSTRPQTNTILNSSTNKLRKTPLKLVTNNPPISLTENHIKIPEYTASILSDILDVRFAIFDGNIKLALELIKSTSSTLKNHTSSYAIMLKKHNDFGIPVDCSVELTKGFHINGSSLQTINQVEIFAKNGDIPAVINALSHSKLAFEFRYNFLPVTSTNKLLEKAQLELKSNEILQANDTLKAIEESLINDKIGIDDTPHQGYRWEEIFQRKLH